MGNSGTTPRTETQLITILKTSVDRAEWTAACAKLFKEHYEGMIRVLMFKCSLPRDEAEYVAAGAWQQALKNNLTNFEMKGPNSFRNWLYQIAYRSFLDFHKSPAQRPLIWPDEALDQCEAPERTSFQTWEHKVTQILDKSSLSPVERDVAYLRLVWEMKASEVATRLRLTSSQEREAWRRAKGKLKKLGKSHFFDD